MLWLPIAGIEPQGRQPSKLAGHGRTLCEVIAGISTGRALLHRRLVLRGKCGAGDGPSIESTGPGGGVAGVAGDMGASATAHLLEVSRTSALERGETGAAQPGQPAQETIVRRGRNCQQTRRCDRRI